MQNSVFVLGENVFYRFVWLNGRTKFLRKVSSKVSFALFVIRSSGGFYRFIFFLLSPSFSYAPDILSFKRIKTLVSFVCFVLFFFATETYRGGDRLFLQWKTDNFVAINEKPTSLCFWGAAKMLWLADFFCHFDLVARCIFYCSWGYFLGSFPERHTEIAQPDTPVLL